MKATGIVRNIDKLGRLVIPMELRKQLDVANEDSAVEFFVDQNQIIIKKYHPSCIFCENVNGLVNYEDKIVCKECIEKLSKIK